MLQACHECAHRGIVGRPRILQQIQNMHVRHRQQALKCCHFVRLKCSAACGQKATQPQIEFEQTATATPRQSIKLSIVFAAELVDCMGLAD